MGNDYKYDILLACIAFAIILMLAGIIITPAMTMVSGFVATLLVGFGMFIDPPIDRKI